MFAIGKKIIYGSEGVFSVLDYTASPVDKSDERLFYVLVPICGPEGNVIYTPVDNDKVPMREAMTREAAEAFLEKLCDIEPIFVEKEKNRRDCYRSAMLSTNPEEYVSIIKAVSVRRAACIKQKRRLAESDTEFEKKAKNCLYGEISVAFDISIREAEDIVTSILEESKKEAE